MISKILGIKHPAGILGIPFWNMCRKLERNQLKFVWKTITTFRVG